MSIGRATAEVPRSGWLEQMPAGWSEVHLRWLAKLYAGGTPDKSNEEFWTDGTIPWINSGAVNQGLITEASAYISQAGYDGSSARWVPKGALVMALAGQGKTKGMVAQMGIDATCNQSMAAIVPDGVNARYLFYWLTANYRRIRSGASDDLRDGLNLQMLGDIPCPVPSQRSDQERIANFLDVQTARIDALIAEKELLFERLQELHRSTLWKQVTKGVQNAPMQFSGVEWIGDCPSHWTVKAIKWLTPVLRGASPRPIDDPKYFDVDGEYGWVRIADVSASNGLLMTTEQQLSALGASLSVKREPGDLFLSIAGTVGKPCIAGIKCCIHDGFVWFPAVGHGLLRDWLFAIFESGFAYAGLGKMGTQLNLNTDTVGSIRIPMPLEAEMTQILERLAVAKVANHGLRNHVEAHISRLREYRSSLISAAVTGQLDLSTFKASA